MEMLETKQALWEHRSRWSRAHQFFASSTTPEKTKHTLHITTVSVRNYRSLKSVKVSVDRYGVLIGANGSGKSSMLYALDWFFNDTPLQVTDVHGYSDNKPLPQASAIEVEVTFEGLTAKDRERLQQYGRGDRAVIRRTWYADSNESKTVGNSRQGPGFSAVRAEQGPAERRKKYRALRAELPELPDLGGNASKDAIHEELAKWETCESNAAKLVDVADCDSKHMMGWNGPNVLRECVQFILVPAATRMAGEIGSASKGTALTELVGAFMSAASAQAQASWLKKHAKAVAALSKDVRASIENATCIQATRINERLSSLVPNATVTLTPAVPELTPRVTPSITTAVTIDGITNDVSRQGHGVQRAVMISMLQAVVPDEGLTRSTHAAHDGEDAESAKARLEEALQSLPAIVVAIEEPEIYQHPIRARAFARTLGQLSSQPGVQVLLATHSPYFVQPDRFSSLRRFTYANGETQIAQSSVTSVAGASNMAKDKVQKAIAAYVPTEFSEGFFADAVVLVEGPTDRAVLEAAALKLGHDLDCRGVTIQSVQGKGGLKVAQAILTTLGIPTYVIGDGDFATAARIKYSKETAEEAEEKRAQAHASHRAATQDLIKSLHTSSTPSLGSLPYTFGDATVVCDDFTIWRDDIEEELEAWASFKKSLASAGVTLAARSNKNLLAYRNAVIDADVADLPDPLRFVLRALQELASAHAADPGGKSARSSPGGPTNA